MHVAPSSDLDYRTAVEFGSPRLPHDTARMHRSAKSVPWQCPGETPEDERAPGARLKMSWAYSSIGQSPRLITGLFLVRTQVGPLHEGVGGYRMVRSPQTRDD